MNLKYRWQVYYSSKQIWDQLFTVDTIWDIGETGDIYYLKIKKQGG